MRSFTRAHEMHTWILAHPRQMQRGKDGKFPVPTPSDVSGSAHFKAKADLAVCVDRKSGFDSEGNFCMAENNDIHIQKVRGMGLNGNIGTVPLSFDVKTRRFVDMPPGW